MIRNGTPWRHTPPRMRNTADIVAGLAQRARITHNRRHYEQAQALMGLLLDGEFRRREGDLDHG
jgi:hypothetical protein